MKLCHAMPYLAFVRLAHVVSARSVRFRTSLLIISWESLTLHACMQCHPPSLSFITLSSKSLSITSNGHIPKPRRPPVIVVQLQVLREHETHPLHPLRPNPHHPILPEIGTLPHSPAGTSASVEIWQVSSFVPARFSLYASFMTDALITQYMNFMVFPSYSYESTNRARVSRER